MPASPFTTVKLSSRFKGVALLDEQAPKLPEFNKDETAIKVKRQVQFHQDAKLDEDGFEVLPARTGYEEKELEAHTIEFWANTKGTLPVWFNAAKQSKLWPVGAEVTEQEFDAAVAATQSIRIG